MAEGEEKEKLVRYTQADTYDKELASKRVSLLDLLEDYPGVKLDLGDFLLSLPALRIRQVSRILVPSLITMLLDADRVSVLDLVITTP
jgi:sulfite reductase alpha subunit-like flavoprotein